MWILRKITNEDCVHYLISQKRSYSVGRKNSDIVLEDDSSISRAHCDINISKKEGCPFQVKTLTGVWIVDKKSKFGTYIKKNQDWMRLRENEVQELVHGSVIRLGLIQNIWRLEYKPVTVCSSKLSTEQKQEVKSLLAAVDGELINNCVKNCGAVIVSEITLTVKVLLGMIHGVPIVTINYLKEVVDCVKQNLPWPDYKLFKPQIAEATLIPHKVSLNIEDHRRELFKGKKFVVPTKEQFESLKEIVVAAGGAIEILKLDGNWRKLAEDNIVLIQLPSSKITNPDLNAKKFKNLSSVLKKEYHVRVVPESEVFRAIAYSSVEKYCNPKSNDFQLQFSKNSFDGHSHGDILVEETPAQSHVGNFSYEKVINSTEDQSMPCSSLFKENDSVSLGKKRNHSPSVERSAKKKALERNIGNGRVEDSQLNFDDDDGDLFSCKEDEPVSEKVIPAPKQDLSLNIRQSPKDTSQLLISQKLQQITEECARFELDDFWNNTKTDDSNKKESEKRKHRISVESAEENGIQAKKKKLKIGNRKSKVVDSRIKPTVEEKEPMSPMPQFQERSFNAPKSVGKVPKNENMHEKVDLSVWIPRKKQASNTGNHEESISTRSVESDWINECRVFKKQEPYVCRSFVEPTPEEYERIGKKLLAAGWIRLDPNRFKRQIEA